MKIVFGIIFYAAAALSCCHSVNGAVPTIESSVLFNDLLPPFENTENNDSTTETIKAAKTTTTTKTSALKLIKTTHPQLTLFKTTKKSIYKKQMQHIKELHLIDEQNLAPHEYKKQAEHLKNLQQEQKNMVALNQQLPFNDLLPPLLDVDVKSDDNGDDGKNTKKSTKTPLNLKTKKSQVSAFNENPLIPTNELLPPLLTEETNVVTTPAAKTGFKTPTTKASFAKSTTKPLEQEIRLPKINVQLQGQQQRNKITQQYQQTQQQLVNQVHFNNQQQSDRNSNSKLSGVTQPRISLNNHKEILQMQLQQTTNSVQYKKFNNNNNNKNNNNNSYQQNQQTQLTQEEFRQLYLSHFQHTTHRPKGNLPTITPFPRHLK